MCGHRARHGRGRSRGHRTITSSGNGPLRLERSKEPKMSIPLNQLGIVKRTIARADREAVERLAKFGVATIHEAMGRVGLLKPGIRPIYAGAQVAGTAV